MVMKCMPVAVFLSLSLSLCILLQQIPIDILISPLFCYLDFHVSANYSRLLSSSPQKLRSRHKNNYRRKEQKGTQKCMLFSAIHILRSFPSFLPPRLQIT